MNREAFRQELLRQEIHTLSQSMRRWKSLETASTITAELFSLGAGLLAFSNAYFGNNILAYLSGSCGFVSVGLRQCTSFCYKQAKRQRVAINDLLKANGELPMPELTPLLVGGEEREEKRLNHL